MGTTAPVDAPHLAPGGAGSPRFLPPNGVQILGLQLFFAEDHLHGGPAPVRRFLPQMIELIWSRTINPGKVSDLALPLLQVTQAYRAMDERRAIKVLLRP